MLSSLISHNFFYSSTFSQSQQSLFQRLLQQNCGNNNNKTYQKKLELICQNIDAIEKRVIDGLAFNLTHLFNGESYYWQRNISTKLTEGSQIPVYSSSEAILHFKESLFLDCRISAFKPSSLQYSEIILNNEKSKNNASSVGPGPQQQQQQTKTNTTTHNNIANERLSSQQQDICCVNFSMIDQDVSPSCGFKSMQNLLNSDSVQQVLSNICRAFHVRRSFSPTTILATGNGLHYYTPMDVQNLSDPLQRQKRTSNKIIIKLKKLSKDSARDFLRFTELFLSNRMCDPVHNSTVSLNNCMMRVPGSINSNNLAQVRVLHSWNGSRKVQADLLYDDFINYLKNQVVVVEKQKKKLLLLQQQNQQYPNQDQNPDNVFSIFRRQRVAYQQNQKRHSYDDEVERIDWIEKLLATPLNDHRKYCIWRIFSRYFINIRHLSFDESYEKISKWLERCAELRALNFNPDARITEKLEYAIANGNCFPIILDNPDKEPNTLRTDNYELYKKIIG